MTHRPQPRPPPYIAGHFRTQRTQGDDWEIQFKNHHGITIELGHGFDYDTADRIKQQLSNILRQRCDGEVTNQPATKDS